MFFHICTLTVGTVDGQPKAFLGTEVDKGCADRNEPHRKRAK